MPPKEKISRAKVTDTAFDMTREYGFKEVTARKLAERLGCSTQPIFRTYENMDELREEIFYLSVNYFCENILSRKNKSRPSYMNMALAYIELAQKERNLFELIASIDDFGTETITEFLKRDEWKKQLDTLPIVDKKSDNEKLELFMMYWMFVHGLASLKVSKRVNLSDKEVKTLLEKSYKGFCTQI